MHGMLCSLTVTCMWKTATLLITVFLTCYHEKKKHHVYHKKKAPNKKQYLFFRTQVEPVGKMVGSAEETMANTYVWNEGRLSTAMVETQDSEVNKGRELNLSAFRE